MCKTRRQVLVKKKSKASKPQKVIKQKKEPKPIRKCSSCQSNYTSFVIGTESKCLKYVTQGTLASAVSVCAKDGARPPLPRNARENWNLLSYFLSVKDRNHLEFTLDLTDAKIEGDFISSTGQKANFTNWAFNEPANSDQLNVVTMWHDGKWGVTNGNYMWQTSGVIICEMNCPLCKYLNSLITLIGKYTKIAINKIKISEVFLKLRLKLESSHCSMFSVQ